MNKNNYWLAVVFALVIGACAPSQESAVALDGTRWELETMEEQRLIPGSRITLVFEAGTFYGSAGCNNYGGKFTTTADSAFIRTEIEKNVMLCLEPAGVMEQEELFFFTFNRSRYYHVEGAELQLTNDAGDVVLIFQLRPNFPDVSPEDLVGMTWRLAGSPELEGVDLEKFTLKFDGQAFVGTTSCRAYAGIYTAEGDRLSIGYLEMTSDESCPPNLLMAEGGFTTLLERVEQYNVTGTQLELFTLQGQKLVFERASE